MSRWSSHSLGEVCDVVAGGTPSRAREDYFGGGIPWVKIGDMLQGTVARTEETISEVGIANSSAKKLPAGTVLISIFATIGRTAVLGIDAATNQAIAGLIPKPGVNLKPAFLRYFLDYSVGVLEAEAHGVAQVNINGKILKSLQVPLPPLAEQMRIVKLLDEADALRKLRAEADRRTAELVPALFFEMFGDVNSNSREWPTVRFAEIGVSRLGKMLDAKQQTGLHARPYLRNANIQWGRIDLCSLAEMDFSESDRDEFRLEEGDLLICEGGEIGRAAIWRNEIAECYFQKALHRVRIGPEIATPEYIMHFLKAIASRDGLRDFVGGATIPHLTGVKLAVMPVTLPPLTLQQEFSQRVSEIRGLEAPEHSSGYRLNDLFQSLREQAFSETRESNRVPT